MKERWDVLFLLIFEQKMTYRQHELDSNILVSDNISDLKLLKEGSKPLAKAVWIPSATPLPVTNFFLHATQADLDELAQKPFRFDAKNLGSKNSIIQTPLPKEVYDFVMLVGAYLSISTGQNTMFEFRIIEHITQKIDSDQFHHDPPLSPNIRPIRAHIGISSQSGSEMQLLATDGLTYHEMFNAYIGNNDTDIPEPQRALETKTGDLVGFWSADWHNRERNDSVLIHRTHPSRANIPEGQRRVSLLWQGKRPPLPGVEII